jgi:hypothetical protein
LPAPRRGVDDIAGAGVAQQFTDSLGIGMVQRRFNPDLDCATSRGSVGAHERVPGLGLELAVHDLVSARRILAAVVSEGAEVQVATAAAQDRLVSMDSYW